MFRSKAILPGMFAAGTMSLNSDLDSKILMVNVTANRRCLKRGTCLGVLEEVETGTSDAHGSSRGRPKLVQK